MSCTLYRFVDDDDRLLYIGITTSACARLAQHSSKEWFPKIARATFEHYRTRAEAMEAEKAAIKAEHPLYNLAHSVAPGELTLGEAAAYIGVVPDTVARWVQRGLIPHHRRKDGPGYRFRKTELDRWLQSLRNDYSTVAS